MILKKTKIKYTEMFADFIGDYKTLLQTKLPFKCKCGKKFMHYKQIYPHLKEHALLLDLKILKG